MNTSSPLPACLIRAIAIAMWGLAMAATARGQACQGTAAIEFQATSTLHDFSGTAAVEPFTFLATLEGPAVILSGTATVAVAKMDTRHAKRDANLRKMFAADQFPLVVGEIDSMRINPAHPQAIPIKLTVRDQPSVAWATLENWAQDENGLRFELKMTLSLRELGLSPPVILGFIKVGDAVSVNVKARLEQ